MKPTVRQRALPTRLCPSRPSVAGQCFASRASPQCPRVTSACLLPLLQTSVERLMGHWQPAGAANAAESYSTSLRLGRLLVNLLRDWNEVTKTTNGAIDGDAVRRVVGTVGVSSPLFQHENPQDCGQSSMSVT